MKKFKFNSQEALDAALLGFLRHHEGYDLGWRGISVNRVDSEVFELVPEHFGTNFDWPASYEDIATGMQEIEMARSKADEL